MPPAAPGPAAAVLAPTAPWPGAPEPAVTAWLSGEPLRWPRWGFGDAWIALAGALVLPILASVPLLIVGGSSSLSNSMIMVVLLVQWLPMIGWPWWATRSRGNGMRLDLGWAIRWSDVGWGVLGGIASLALATAVGALTMLVFGSFTSSAGDLVDEVSADRLVLVALVIGIGFVAPVVEEVCFRGLFWSALAKRGTAPWWTTGWTALAFACFHLEPVRIPLLLSTGLVLGYLRQRTGRLGAPIVAHMVNNSFAALGLLLV